MLDGSGDCLCGTSTFCTGPRGGVYCLTPAGKKSYRRDGYLSSRVLARGEYPLLTRSLGSDSGLDSEGLLDRRQPVKAKDLLAFPASKKANRQL